MPTGRTTEPRWHWWAAALSPLLALLVVRPWHSGAFPVWDFAEMLPILRSSTGAWDALMKLAEFTRADGRANYLTYIQIVATWTIAGDNPVLWQWQRGLLMLGLGGAFVCTVRRLGGTPSAAAIGALMLMLGGPGIEGWLYLCGEPLASILLLGIILLGIQPPSLLRGLMLVLFALGTMLAKEVAGVLLPVFLLVALTWNPGGGWQLRWPGRSLRQLAFGLGVVLVVEAGSVLAALRDAHVGAYATQFQPGVEGLARAPILFWAMFLPVRLAASGTAGALYPANVAFLGLLGLGGLAFLRARRVGGLGLIATCLSVPAIGAVLYAFWPRYSAFYGIPFALGGAGLLAAALTAGSGAGRTARWVTTATSAALLTFVALSSMRTVAARQAFANLALSAVVQLGNTPAIDSVFVVKAGAGKNRWPVTGPELERYAAAMRVPPSRIPVIRDAPCDAVAARLHSGLGRSAILNDQNACGPLPATTYRFAEPVDRWDWLSFTMRRDTLQLDLLIAPPTPR